MGVDMETWNEIGLANPKQLSKTAGRKFACFNPSPDRLLRDAKPRCSLTDAEELIVRRTALLFARFLQTPDCGSVSMRDKVVLEDFKRFLSRLPGNESNKLNQIGRKR
jgi:hypothetical protein